MSIDWDRMKPWRRSEGRNSSRRVPAKLNSAPPNGAEVGWTSSAIDISPPQGETKEAYFCLRTAGRDRAATSARKTPL